MLQFQVWHSSKNHVTYYVNSIQLTLAQHNYAKLMIKGHDLPKISQDFYVKRFQLTWAQGN